MESRVGRRSLALVCAAVLGITLGVVVGLQTNQPAPSGAVASNPLEIENSSLQNVQCDGSVLMIVGYGDRAARLQPSASNWPNVRYLDKSRSCSTAPLPGGKTDRYATYLGPYDTMLQACTELMTPEHERDSVVRMKGVDDAVPCLCVLPISSFPKLELATTPSADVTADTVMWTRAYQRLMVGAGFLKRRQATGIFDEPTAFATQVLQTSAGGNATGQVDITTWDMVQNRTCGNFDY